MQLQHFRCARRMRRRNARREEWEGGRGPRCCRSGGFALFTLVPGQKPLERLCLPSLLDEESSSSRVYLTPWPPCFALCFDRVSIAHAWLTLAVENECEQELAHDKHTQDLGFSPCLDSRQRRLIITSESFGRPNQLLCDAHNQQPSHGLLPWPSPLAWSLVGCRPWAERRRLGCRVICLCRSQPCEQSRRVRPKDNGNQDAVASLEIQKVKEACTQREEMIT